MDELQQTVVSIAEQTAQQTVDAVVHDAVAVVGNIAEQGVEILADLEQARDELTWQHQIEMRMDTLSSAVQALEPQAMKDHISSLFLDLKASMLTDQIPVSMPPTVVVSAEELEAEIPPAPSPPEVEAAPVVAADDDDLPVPEMKPQKTSRRAGRFL